MTLAPAGLALAAIAFGYALSPSPSPDGGKRVESDSYTPPTAIARCITYNINKKQPELAVSSEEWGAVDGSIYLILNTREQTPTTFGVIRIDQSLDGSHLTTLLNTTSLSDASQSEIAKKLVAGC